jgi:CBS domain-containing protein
MKIESILPPLSRYLRPNASLSAVARLLEVERLTALPVVNYDGTIQGIITAQDVVAANADASDSEEARVASQLVRSDVVTCTLADEVVSVASQAKSQNCTHVAVIDDSGNLLGIADLSPYQDPLHEVQHREEVLDEALEETFPASDPISPA